LPSHNGNSGKSSCWAKGCTAEKKALIDGFDIAMSKERKNSADEWQRESKPDLEHRQT